MGNVSKWTMLCGSQYYSHLGQEPGLLFVAGLVVLHCQISATDLYTKSVSKCVLSAY